MIYGIGDTINSTKLEKFYAYPNTNYIQETEHEIINSLRRASEIHKTARNTLIKNFRCGMKYVDICDIVEGTVNDEIGNSLDGGMGFPVGISANNVCAHDTAFTGDDRIIKNDSIYKIDIGVHVNGYIIDSAFSVSLTPRFEKLMEASKTATNEAIKYCGPDVHVSDISKLISEVISSFEIELDGKNNHILPIKHLGGHNIIQNKIHGGKLILCAPYDNLEYQQTKMKEGEIYAIETFASTGTGNITQNLNVPMTHFMLNDNYTTQPTSGIGQKCLSYVKKYRKTLPFSGKWLECVDKNYSKGLHELLKKGIITGYPVVCDVEDSFVSQYEHTLFLHENGKEILSIDNDY